MTSDYSLLHVSGCGVSCRSWHRHFTAAASARTAGDDHSRRSVVGPDFGRSLFRGSHGDGTDRG